MVWDHRPDHHPFYGIVKQELDGTSFELIGTPKLIFKGTEIGLTEGPHIYKKDSRNFSGSIFGVCPEAFPGLPESISGVLPLRMYFPK